MRFIVLWEYQVRVTVGRLAVIVVVKSVTAVSDTTNAAETTEIMSMSWRRTETSIEFGSQITWRHSHDTDAITGKIDRTHGQLQVTLSAKPSPSV